MSTTSWGRRKGTGRRASWSRCAAACICIASAAGDAAAQTRVGVDTVGWLAGCWQGKLGTSVVEESWLAPRSNSIAGVGRATDSARLRSLEFMQIFVRRDTLIYAATPISSPRAEFAATSITSSEVIFEDPAHDFPKRVGYRKAGHDSLFAFVDGPATGATRRIEYGYGRVACPR